MHQRPQELQSLGLGTTFVELSTYALKNFLIDLPDSQTQRRIAAYLDEQTSKIDRLMELRRRQMALLKEQRAAMIQQAVTRGMNHNVPMKDSGLPWLGDIPAHWEVTQVRRLLSFVTSGARGWAEFYSDDGDIFVQSGNLSRDMSLDLDNAQRIQPPPGAECERTRLAQNDVLVCITGALTGNVSFVGFEPPNAYVNQHVAILRPKENLVIPKFLATALWSEHGRIQFKLAEYGGTKQGLSFDDLRFTLIALPPKNEQTEILDFIQQESEQIDQLHAAYSRQLTLLAEYRAALIHECVTGQRPVPGTASA